MKRIINPHRPHRSLQKRFITAVQTFFLAAKPGRLSWYVLILLSIRNLRSRWSRTVVTGGAIALGVAAIIFLVSFGYGLQQIVTTRLVHPNALKLIDVQSDSTALQLNQDTAATLKKLPEVADVAKMVSLAGSITIGTQKTETVVIGLENSFITYSNMLLVSGSTFSKEADAPYQATDNEVSQLAALLQGGQVAGATNEPLDISIGDSIQKKPVSFRVPDNTYLPLYNSVSKDRSIIGYVRGSVLEQYQGIEVWGSSYPASGTDGRAYRTASGDWLGKWIKASVPLYEEAAPTVYVPKSDTVGRQVVADGFLPTGGLTVLSPVEAEVYALSNQVLGDTDTASAAAEDIRTTGAATLAAELQSLLIEETAAVATGSGHGGTVSVARQGGKEIIVSSGLLSLLKLDPKAILRQPVTLTMIVSGGLIPGMSGRVLSQPVDYSVVGVIKDDSRPIVYVPLGDITSMGVDRFSIMKVLTSSEDTVKAVRERIEAIGFMTQSLADTLLQVERLFRIMRFLLGAFGGIALVVALLGMFNTLTISLLERTREIGVMKTLGTTNVDVVRLYITESVIIGITGGLVGTIIGIVLGETVDLTFQLFRQGSHVSLFNTPPGLAFIMIIVATAVGLLTGLIPAKRATTISALDALRYE